MQRNKSHILIDCCLLKIRKFYHNLDWDLFKVKSSMIEVMFCKMLSSSWVRSWSQVACLTATNKTSVQSRGCVLTVIGRYD